MAAHVVADAHFGFGGRHEMKMGIEARDAVQLVERSLRAIGKGFEFRLWQITEAKLYGSQFVEDHRLGLVKLRRIALPTGAFPGNVTPHTRCVEASCK